MPPSAGPRVHTQPRLVLLPDDLIVREILNWQTSTPKCLCYSKLVNSPNRCDGQYNRTTIILAPRTREFHPMERQ